jgi:hypothetical protein
MISNFMFVGKKVGAVNSEAEGRTLNGLRGRWLNLSITGSMRGFEKIRLALCVLRSSLVREW